MHAGWILKFKVNRKLSGMEKKEHLSYKASQRYIPSSGGLIKFNSTYIEYLDRRFKNKGELLTLMAVLVFFFFLWVAGAVAIEGIQLYPYRSPSGVILSLVLFSFIVCAAFFVGWIVKKDLFTYSYYPIRFNRKTQKIYFFQSNGVITLPWGDKRVFFHIGHGYEKKIHDLRCHWMPNGPNGLIKQTFVVGGYSHHENFVREEWELIRRYMEDGPEHCFDNEFDRIIDESPCTSWRCCYERVLISFGSFISLRYLLFPLVFLMTLSRWLTFKTCRKPIWPVEVEAESTIEPDDPYLLPEPDVITGKNDLVERKPGYLDRSLIRLKQRATWDQSSQEMLNELPPEMQERILRAEKIIKDCEK